MADLNDGKPWSDMDLFDLRNCAERGYTVRDAAEFLCRSGTPDEVAAKAREIGVELKIGQEE